jgi:hypothetical protein
VKSDTQARVVYTAANKSATVRNLEATPWPEGCTVVVELDYAPTLDDDPNQFSPNDWLEIVKKAAAPAPAP